MSEDNKEVDQCPQCYGSVEITNGCKTKCKNCGFHVRDCSDLG